MEKSKPLADAAGAVVVIKLGVADAAGAVVVTTLGADGELDARWDC